jgi:hypothetical protein
MSHKQANKRGRGASRQTQNCEGRAAGVGRIPRPFEISCRQPSKAAGRRANAPGQTQEVQAPMQDQDTARAPATLTHSPTGLPTGWLRRGRYGNPTGGDRG